MKVGDLRLDRSRTGHPRRLALVVLPMSLLLVLAACGGAERPDRIVTPDAVGVIEMLMSSEDGTTTTLFLETGEEVVVHNADDIDAYGTLNAGSLLVSGQLDDARWHMSLAPSEEVPPDCYVPGVAPFDDGSHVVFPAGGPSGAYGIRLPKSEDFVAEDPDPRTQRYGRAESPTFFCVNSVGEVTGQEDTLRRESE